MKSYEIVFFADGPASGTASTIPAGMNRVIRGLDAPRNSAVYERTEKTDDKGRIVFVLAGWTDANGSLLPGVTRD